MTSGFDESAERQRFVKLQERLPKLFRQIFPDDRERRTVVVIPSLSMDAEVLSKVAGVQYYEERMLCMLMLLRLPRTRVIFITSVPIHPAIIDYNLHLLAGIPGGHARRRLTMLACHDASPIPLTQKILDRPRLVQRIRRAIKDPTSTHMTCFNVTDLERSLALKLDVPIYGCDPAICDLGSKSGSREVFREAGILLPEGHERLRDEHDVAEALAELKHSCPDLRRAAIKLEEGFSGEGNALFSFDGCPDGTDLRRWIAAELPRRIAFEAAAETWDRYRAKFLEMGGIVECFIEGAEKCSPSVQCRINPLGEAELISTHDQVLGGPSGQVFVGCTFPASPEYRMEIQDAGDRVSEVLARHGVIGRFGVDFVSVREADRWRHYAIEINLRKGGTTHPYMTLQFLTRGDFDHDSGTFKTPEGRVCCYYSSDNLRSPRYRGLLPEDLIDIAVDHDLHYHRATHEGVVFHLLGALSEFGKLGVVCVAETVAKARQLYDDTVAVLDREAQLQEKERISS
jgi:hypothetical protein